MSGSASAAVWTSSTSGSATKHSDASARKQKPATSVEPRVVPPHFPESVAILGEFL